MKKQMKVLVFVLAFSLMLSVAFGFAMRPTMAEETAESTTVTHLTEVPEGYVGIYTKFDLDNVRNNFAGNYILMNDIEFTDADFAEGGIFYNDGAGWIPFGDTDNYFTGTFDGNGYAIKNLYVNIEGYFDIYAGLFGYIDGGTVKNLGMVDSDITATSTSLFYNSKAGGIVGYMWDGTISNCYNTGDVASSDLVGGIIGGMGDGTVSNCYNTGDVTSSNENWDSSVAGGIIGSMSSNSEVYNCYNKGFVSATSTWHSFAGGIGGSIADGTISNCYNTGSVSVTSGSNPYAGGIVGTMSSCEVSNCYNTGSMSATASNDSVVFAGGITADMDGGMVSNCYYLDNIDWGVDCTDRGINTGTGTDTCTKCTAEQMKQQSTFVGFDFDTVWYFDSSSDYLFPLLQAFFIPSQDGNSPEIPEGFTPIYTKEDLNNIRNDLSGNYILMNDIEFTDADFAVGGEFYNDGTGWIPMGMESNNIYVHDTFTGVFDGNGYLIKNLYININNSHNATAGLFAYCDGIVKNLGLVQSNIKANSRTTTSTNSSIFIGSIVGYLRSGGIIDNCFNAGNVSATTLSAQSYAGGLVGKAIGKVINSYNMGTVVAASESSGAYAGGIVGYSTHIISNCYNTGTVNGLTNTTSFLYDSSTGGIVGHLEKGVINNCYNTGNVNSSSKYSFGGGIVGYSDTSIVENSYNIGDVTGYHIGGVIGEQYNGTVNNCYYLNTISTGVGYYVNTSSSNDENGTNAFTCCTVQQLMQQPTFMGFDFCTVWTMSGNDDYFYPELQGVEMLFVKQLESIIVTTKPNKLNYEKGDPFDSTGMVVEKVYDNGTTEEIGLSEVVITGFDNAKFGNQTLTVLYEGKTDSFIITVNANYAEGEIKNGYYLVGGKPTEMGLFQHTDGYYYVAQYDGKIIANQKYYVWLLNSNCDLEKGWYAFDENGRAIKNGIFDGVYYEDYKPTEKGLMNIDGDYYYVGPNGKLVVNQKYYAWKTACDLPTAWYWFDENGKMIGSSAEGEIVTIEGEKYFYRFGKPTEMGLFQCTDGKYYFSQYNGKIVTSKNYTEYGEGKFYVWKFHETAPAIKADWYFFGEDGAMLQGIHMHPEKNDLYFFENGKVKDIGFFKYSDGNYYCTQTGGKLVTSENYTQYGAGKYYVWKLHESANDKAKGWYFFDETGKMIVK